MGCLVVGKKNQENVKIALLCRWVTYNSPTDMHEAIGSNGYVESKRKVEIKKTLAIAEKRSYNSPHLFARRKRDAKGLRRR